MDRAKLALRLAASVCLLALAACSGGGGGGGVNTGLNNAGGTGNTGSTGNTGGTGGTTTPTPTVSIGAPDHANVAIQASSFNFTTNLPPIGAVIGLLGPAVKVNATTVEAAGTTINSNITYRGMVTSGGTSVPVFDVSIPAVGLTASNVRADGTTATLADGSKVVLTITTLNYTAAGAWGYTLAGGSTAYLGAAAAGSGTPIAAVQISGTGSYSGSGARGGVGGIYFVPSGSGGISTGSLTGDISITVNFSTGGVTGALSNMMATPGTGGAATPWNSVALTGSVNRLANNASITGTTSTSGAPAGSGTPGFTSAATGNFGAAFFGPNADEVGGTWTLTDPNAAGGGQTAFGAFGATSSGCNGCNTGSGGGGTTTPSVSITPPGLGLAILGGSNNFTTNLPAVGTQITLGGATAALTSTSVAPYTTGPVTATFRGTVSSGGLTFPVFDLSVPSLSLTANNLNADGSLVTLADGGKVSAKFGALTYTLMGAWSYSPAGAGTTYLSQSVAGYGTPTASVPTTGSATYTGTGGVVGAYFVPNGTGGIQSGTLSGDVSLNVDFAGNKATGSFTNMQAKPTLGTTSTPWNNITLNNGSLTRPTTGVIFDGQMSTAANTGPAGFSAAASGAFHGAFYGPAAQEVGGTWFLSETGGGGKAAYGTFGAKQ